MRCYSLPDDDLEVAYLLKRALVGKQPHQLTVVEYDTQKPSIYDHPVGRRFATLSGVPASGWRTDGFEGWLSNPNL
jgi:hypothetical protein